jgi:small subunit ribosomal protein S15
MGQYQTHETDTGSADVQIAVLTEQINKLSEHLKVNQNDFASRRGLLKKIGTRKRLLNYLKKTNEERYKSLISRLGIRG